MLEAFFNSHPILFMLCFCALLMCLPQEGATMMGVAVLMMAAIAILTGFLAPAFGIPAFFYAWLGVNIVASITGIVFLVLQKDC